MFVCVCVRVCETTLVVFSPLKFTLRRDGIKKAQSRLVDTVQEHWKPLILIYLLTGLVY